MKVPVSLIGKYLIWWLKLFSKGMDTSLIDENRLVTISRSTNNTGTVV